ncbi:MAG: proteasome assembly chaperone family protein [Halobacteria archaeon]|nr:proteasome assembly chaperone family protein [Halobacteria archaeon]
MTHINIERDDIELQDPYMIEGLPGIGLVGKIATDHIVEILDMTYYAYAGCEGLPDVAVFESGESDLKPPVRIFADEENDLLALQSEVPVSPSEANCFADCVTDWLNEVNGSPIYISGLPKSRDPSTKPDLFGVSTHQGGEKLKGVDLDPPTESGIVSGPTGALLNRAGKKKLDAVGLIVETDPQFADPQAARVLIEEGINPIAGVDIDTKELMEHAEDIREQKRQLAKQMQEAEEDESSQAAPVGMYQ